MSRRAAASRRVPATRLVAVRGFTLIELLVALSVLGLIAYLSFDGLRFAMRAWGGTVERSEALHEVASAQRFLRSRLQSLYVFDVERGGARVVCPVEGDAQSISFSAPLTAGSSTFGLQRFTLARNANPGGRYDLAVSWFRDRNGQPDSPAATPARETLVVDVVALDIDYLASEAGSPALWVRQWREREDAPRLVRIRVKFPEGDPRRWPDLIVAPHIDTDANCAFDVVSQRCR